MRNRPRCPKSYMRRWGAVQALAAMGAKLPNEHFRVVWTNEVTPENQNWARLVSGFGRSRSSAGSCTTSINAGRSRSVVTTAPTSTNSVATNAWEQVTGVVVRAILPEISPGSYFAPGGALRNCFEGNDDGRLLRQLRIAPTLNINCRTNRPSSFKPGTFG